MFIVLFSVTCYKQICTEPNKHCTIQETGKQGGRSFVYFFKDTMRKTFNKPDITEANSHLFCLMSRQCSDEAGKSSCLCWTLCLFDRISSAGRAVTDSFILIFTINLYRKHRSSSIRCKILRSDIEKTFIIWIL